VISGDDNYTLPYLACGMDGVISVMCNGTPATFSDMVHSAIKGDIGTARSLHYKLLDLMNLIFSDGSPGGIKVILEHKGICMNNVRPPLAVVNKKVAEEILSAYKKAGEPD
jgi:4-hydroxy-tetrahydrodipicolinate synthase